MKRLEKPKIEIIKFDVKDIITTSEHDNAFGDIADLLSLIFS